MRDQEKRPKLLTSRRRGGLIKHQNNSFFDLERHHLVCGAMVAIAPFFLLPHPLLLNRGVHYVEKGQVSNGLRFGTCECSKTNPKENPTMFPPSASESFPFAFPGFSEFRSDR